MRGYRPQRERKRLPLPEADCTLEEAADELQRRGITRRLLSRSRVQQMETAALMKIRERVISDPVMNSHFPALVHALRHPHEQH